MKRTPEMTDADWDDLMKDDWKAWSANDQQYQEALQRGWIKDGQIPRVWAAGFKAGTGSFDLRWAADMRAIKRWQAEKPGRELTWPSLHLNIETPSQMHHRLTEDRIKSGEVVS